MMELTKMPQHLISAGDVHVAQTKLLDRIENREAEVLRLMGDIERLRQALIHIRHVCDSSTAFDLILTLNAVMRSSSIAKTALAQEVEK